MIAEQRKVIEEFKTLKRGLTIRQMAAHLGIERTRYFRVLNGYEMKLSEYLAMKKVIGEAANIGVESGIEEFGLGMRQDLYLTISRAKRMKQLLGKVNLMGNR